MQIFVFKVQPEATALNGHKNQVKKIHPLDILLDYLWLSCRMFPFSLKQGGKGFINLGQISVEVLSFLEAAFEKWL